MSFILDALKKSENERQRTIGPSLADAPARIPQSERPWWAVAVAALLVINLGVLIVVLVRNHSTAVPTEAPAPVASAPAQAAAPATAPPTQAMQSSTQRPQQEQPPTNPAVRSLAEEAGSYNEPYRDPVEDAEVNPPETAASSGLAGASNVPQGPPIVRPIDAPAVAPLDSRSTPPSRAAASSASNEILPTLNSLAAGGTSLPDLHLDIHVYSDKPPERFVFVNMKKYVEGQTLSEGPSVERITPDGVILNQQGLRFLLPRQ
ncbi:MAG TPA: general secretion pathway protein GspB [Steroidobacteraceae bacterium]|jgi:general secretion pathway protein B